MKKKSNTYSAEKAKLDHKQHYTIAGTCSSKIIDELTSYTARVFNTKVAVINFVDQHNLWPKKGQPMDKLSGVYTETNVCSMAMIHEIEDYFEGPIDPFIATPALMTNAMIAGEFGMRFYASAPITNDDGVQLGTVCILDKRQRELLPQEREKLTWIAEMVKEQVSRRIAKKLAG